MCNQAVSLVAAEIERRGVATVTLVLLRKVAERVRLESAGVAVSSRVPARSSQRPARAAARHRGGAGAARAAGPPPVLVDYERVSRGPRREQVDPHRRLRASMASARVARVQARGCGQRRQSDPGRALRSLHGRPARTVTGVLDFAQHRPDARVGSDAVLPRRQSRGKHGAIGLRPGRFRP